MIRFEVGTEDLLHSRFALSPAMELSNVLRRLAGLARYPVPVHWLDQLRPAFQRLRRDTDLNAALALHSPRAGADFIALPPQGMAQTWADDLAATRATPLRQARAEIEQCLRVRPVTDPRVLTVLRGRDVVERIAAAQDAAWRELVAPDWPQLRAICERDVVHRAGLLGRSGWAAALDGLHPSVSWRDGASTSDRCAAAGSTSAVRDCCSSRPSTFGRPWRHTPTGRGRRHSSIPRVAARRCGIPNQRRPPRHSPTSSADPGPGCC